MGIDHSKRRNVPGNIGRHLRGWSIDGRSSDNTELAIELMENKDKHIGDTTETDNMKGLSVRKNKTPKKEKKA